MKAVNLIPREERRSSGGGIPTGRSGGAVFAVLGVLAGLAVLALLYGRADHQISSRRAEVASLNARVQQAQARTGALAAYTSFLQMREQRVQAVTALMESRFDWAQVFHELGRVLPANQVSLSSVEGTVGSSTGTAGATAGAPASTSTSATTSSGAAGASSVTSATPPGSIPTFKLAGCATSQAEVALMLERLRLIDGVKEVTLQSSTKSGSGGGSAAGSNSGCPASAPVFAAQVVFDALPTVPTGSSSGAATITASATATSGATSTSAGAPSR